MLYFGKISTLVSPTPLEGTSREGKSISLSDTLIINLKGKNKRSGIAFLTSMLAFQILPFPSDSIFYNIF